MINGFHITRRRVFIVHTRGGKSTAAQRVRVFDPDALQRANPDLKRRLRDLKDMGEMYEYEAIWRAQLHSWGSENSAIDAFAHNFPDAVAIDAHASFFVLTPTDAEFERRLTPEMSDRWIAAARRNRRMNIFNAGEYNLPLIYTNDLPTYLVRNGLALPK